MNDIVICIPTYKRPTLLKALLISILASSIDKSLIKGIIVIVADNDLDKTAETTVLECSNTLDRDIGIIYEHCPVKGLSNVRNYLLERAFDKSPKFILFIDDDQVVEPLWVNEMVKAIVINGCELVMGPVDSIFDESVPSYITTWFARDNYKNNTKLDFLSTRSLIIDAEFLLGAKVWFDTKFNRTGGEDSYFGIQLMKKGAKIYWAANAKASEIIPPDRANRKWLFKRSYSGANQYSYILIVEKSYIQVMKKFIISFFYVCLGILTVPLMLLPMKKRYWGLFKIAEGMGGLFGLLAFRYDEYK